MLWWVGDIQSGRIGDGTALFYPGRLPAQEGSHQLETVVISRDPQNTAVINRFLPAPQSPLCWSMVQLLLGTIVWSQFKINSGGISFISTVATTSSKNSVFTRSKSATAYLLFAVVTFLCTKFIRCSNEYAKCRFSSTCPPTSVNIDLSRVNTIPHCYPRWHNSSLSHLLQIQLHLPTKIVTQQTSCPFLAQRGHHYLLLFCSLSYLPSKLLWLIE